MGSQNKRRGKFDDELGDMMFERESNRKRDRRNRREIDRRNKEAWLYDDVDDYRR